MFVCIDFNPHHGYGINLALHWMQLAMRDIPSHALVYKEFWNKCLFMVFKNINVFIHLFGPVDS